MQEFIIANSNWFMFFTSVATGAVIGGFLIKKERIRKLLWVIPFVILILFLTYLCSILGFSKLNLFFLVFLPLSALGHLYASYFGRGFVDY